VGPVDTLQTMELGIRTNRDAWRTTAWVTVFAVTVSQLGIGLVYWIGGEDVFTLTNVMLIAAALPTVITLPVMYFVCRMSLQLHGTKAGLQELANTDPLTGLPNRRAFFQAAEQVLHNNAPVATLLVIDADYFKELNDTYGHALGDKALINIAEILRASFRSDDLVCRTGGEEFAVLVPNTTVHNAQLLAQRVVSKVAASPLSEPDALIEYTVSCGIADSTHAPDFQSLLKAADDALYLANSKAATASSVCPRPPKDP